MLTDFQLAAIVKKGAKWLVLRIPMHQTLQDTLAASWHTQYVAFTQGTKEIAFDPGYAPEDDERFCVGDYALPDWLNVGGKVQNLDPISQHENQLDTIKAIIAFARNAQGEELMLAQNFSRSHVIQPGSFLFLEKDNYESPKRPGLTLDSKLSALYVVAQKTLLFHNFRAVNSFLPLADYYKEASEHEILEILGHERLAPENAATLAGSASQWMKKRFAMLKHSGILDQYEAKQIKAHSKGYEVDVKIKDKKIVFPADKNAAKRLLQFLNEELYKGAITETLYETNSKREAD